MAFKHGQSIEFHGRGLVSRGQTSVYVFEGDPRLKYYQVVVESMPPIKTIFGINLRQGMVDMIHRGLAVPFIVCVTKKSLSLA